MHVVQTPQGWILFSDNGVPIGLPFQSEQEALLQGYAIKNDEQGSGHATAMNAFTQTQQPLVADKPAKRVLEARPVKPAAPVYTPPEQIDTSALHQEALRRGEESTALEQMQQGARGYPGLYSREQRGLPGSAELNFSIQAPLEAGQSIQAMQSGKPTQAAPQAPAQFRQGYLAQQEQFQEAHPPIHFQHATDPEDVLASFDRSVRERNPSSGPITYDEEGNQRGLRGPLGPIGYERDETKEASPAEKRAFAKQQSVAGVQWDDEAHQKAIDSRLASSPFKGYVPKETTYIEGRPVSDEELAAQPAAKPSIWERMLKARTFQDLFDD